MFNYFNSGFILYQVQQSDNVFNIICKSVDTTDVYMMKVNNHNSIEDVKTFIHMQNPQKYQVEKLKLNFNGKTVHSDRTIGFYKMSEDSRIHFKALMFERLVSYIV